MSALAFAERQHLLERLSLLYLAVPILIFIPGWLTPLLALPAGGLVLWGLYRSWNCVEDPAATDGPSASSPALPSAVVYGVLFAVVVFTTLYSGIGGYAHQYSDYWRHNTFLRDLIDYAWPLGYADIGADRKPRMLAFYLGNQLLPALVGKGLGWSAANLTSLVMAALGLYMAVCWFLKILGRKSIFFGLLFLFFGALDIFTELALLGWYEDGAAFRRLNHSMYFWTRAPEIKELMGGLFWIRPGNLSFMMFTPQHAFGCWLALFVILYDAIHRKTCERVGFVWGCTLLWSPFSFVGLAPFVLVAILATRFRGLFSTQNTVAGSVIFVISALFIGSNNQQYEHGFLWEFQDLLRTWPTLLLYYGTAFGVYALVCPRVDAGAPGSIDRIWWWTAIACLLLFPLYHLGAANDLSIKASIPATVVFLLVLASALRDAKTEVQLRSARILIGWMLVGSLATISDVGHQLSKGLTGGPIPMSKIPHLNQIRSGGLEAQLFGDPDGFFWTYVAKPSPKLAGRPARK